MLYYHCRKVLFKKDGMIYSLKILVWSVPIEVELKLSMALGGNHIIIKKSISEKKTQAYIMYICNWHPYHTKFHLFIDYNWPEFIDIALLLL